MATSWLYNVSYNYTININLNDITSILYYPFLLIILVLIPIIILIITLFLKRSEETKVSILSFNLIYLLLLPFLALNLIQDYRIKAYVINALLNDILFINTYYGYDLVLTFILQNLLFIVLFELILTIIFMVYYAIIHSTKR